MRPIQNAEGHVGLTAREYPINESTAIIRGQVVQLQSGLVAAAGAAQTGAILGVAAEDHPGTEDVLNPRANGGTILVYDNPGLIFECPVPEVTATSGTATTVVCTQGDLAQNIGNGVFNGGLLRLKSRAADSANTDVPGAMRRITGFAGDTRTFTAASGGTPSSGDVYQVFPPVGCNVLGLDGQALRSVLTQTGATAIRVVGHDVPRGMIRCMAALHTLA